MKKILIIRPKVEEIFNEDGTVVVQHNYTYPKGYNAKHASHICYNFANGKNIKGGHLGEGMVIYDAEEAEIQALLKEDGVEEMNFDTAKLKGKQWKPAKVIDGVEKAQFDINEFTNRKELNE